jgi:hypothetical protein
MTQLPRVSLVGGRASYTIMLSPTRTSECSLDVTVASSPTWSSEGSLDVMWSGARRAPTLLTF